MDSARRDLGGSDPASAPARSGRGGTNPLLESESQEYGAWIQWRGHGWRNSKSILLHKMLEKRRAAVYDVGLLLNGGIMKNIVNVVVPRAPRGRLCNTSGRRLARAVGACCWR